MNPAPIFASELTFDINKLVEAYYRLIERYPFHPEWLQIALTHSQSAQSASERAYDGIGSLSNPRSKWYQRSPHEFVIFNRDFEDLYFYEVFKKVTEWSQLPIARMRLMLRKPFSCYSMHVDKSERFHLALTSNPDCYVVFKSHGIYQIPTDGQLYRFDATLPHTAMNAGPTDRVHLVFETLVPTVINKKV